MSLYTSVCFHLDHLYPSSIIKIRSEASEIFEITKSLGKKPAFVKKFYPFVQDEIDLETTQLIGYTKGCETEEAVIKQRQNAKDRFDELDKLICKYAYLKSGLNGKTPYEWEGFLPQLFGKEVGDGIPTPKKESGIDLSLIHI